MASSKAPGSSATATTSTSYPSSSSSQSLLLLLKSLLPPDSPDALLSSHFASALQMLSNAASSSASGVGGSSEMAVAESIKRKLIRQGREQDAVSFSRLHQRLQRSEVLHNRQAVLTLLLNLSEQPARKGYKKVAPFMPYRPPTSVFSNGAVQARPQEQQPGSNGEGNDLMSGSGDRAGAGYLSSVHQIRHNLTPAAASRDRGGYHPPVPPKPKSPISVLKSRSAGEVSTVSSSKPKSRTASKAQPLLRELVYTFQGIEGTLIKRDKRSDKFCLVPGYAETLSPSVVQICQRLSELGWLFNRVRRFCEDTLEDGDVGLSGQALVTAIKNELSEYYQLLSTLEVQAADADAGDASLHHLCVWTMEPTNRMKLLASICEACRGKRGGVLVSAIYDFLPHGDRSCSDMVRALLTTACNPMYLMLLRWICDGTLEDPHNEFFIAADPRVTGERLWSDKYSVREEMIPKFLTLAWVRKIMATGKSINFLHEVCHDSSPITGREVVKAMLDETSPESLFNDPQGDNVLHRTIQRAFTDTSSHVLGILFSKYKFQEHMSALRKYLLLGQGDIIRYLLQLLEQELGRPASQLYPHNLAGLLETAIRATNAQFEDPEILERLDVRLLDVQPGDTGWDVFSLDYKMSGPVGTVFNQNVMTSYLMLFNALWRAKRVEWMLSCVWKLQAGLHKMCKTIPELKPLLHIANLLTSEMVHFIHQLAYYITFEVMECSWDVLNRELRTAESLDEVIGAHEVFLKTLLSKSLLDERSRELLTQLRAIYDRIIEFQGIQSKLYVAALAEVEERNAEERCIAKNEREGRYGLTEQDEEASRERVRTFNKIILQNLKSKLKIVSQSYQDMVRTFLLQLACSQDQSLQCLSFRLDFNQHYKRKDARLGTPLTFQHRRESMLTASFHV